MNTTAVITTIQKPTKASIDLSRFLAAHQCRLIVAGDRKGPDAYQLPNTTFLSLRDQLEGPFTLAKALPESHYARKNIGYLEAIQQGATCIYETDDDNAPLDSWAPRSEMVSNARILSQNALAEVRISQKITTENTEDAERDKQRKGQRVADDFDISAFQHFSVSAFPSQWINVYRYFTDELIWPRGFPLNEIHTPVPEALPRFSAFSFHPSSFPKSSPKSSPNSPNSPNSRLNSQSPAAPLLCPSGSSAVPLRSPIQQGLVNGSPDVDAIWRLTLDRPFTFNNRLSVYLEPGNWCPFNTQSTWWWPVAYPLLYVPSHCSFRMCDIWKSFVAQRCLWELGLGVTFHAPEAFQERNEHDLMRDFADEVPGYQRNCELADVLDRVRLTPGEAAVGSNLLACYEALVAADFFPSDELELVKLWLADISG